MPILTTIALVSLVAAKKAPPAYIGYVNFKHGKARYHMVVADLNSNMISAGTMMSSGSQPVWSMIKREYPYAAITGTFFAPRQGIPVADVLVDGTLKATGNRGSGISVDEFGSVNIFDERFRQKFDWTNFKYGLRGAVRVVSNKKVAPNPKAQHFKDRRIWGSAARTGVGLTKHNKLVLIATSKPITLSEFGKAMVSQGVVDGLSLDGGSSTCLYFNGSMVISPRRQLTNLFVLHDRPPSGIAAIQEQRGAATATIATVKPEILPNMEPPSTPEIAPDEP
jgi:hypothetical protein